MSSLSTVDYTKNNVVQLRYELLFYPKCIVIKSHFNRQSPHRPPNPILPFPLPNKITKPQIKQNPLQHHPDPTRNTKLYGMKNDEPEESLTRSIDVDDDELQEAEFSRKGCCFYIPCFYGSGQKDSASASWERFRPEDVREDDNTDKWWRKAAMKVREWSELVAGPKWKTFIRRFNKNRTGQNRTGVRKFNYDPVDYAKNFDDGGVDCDDDDVLRRGFSLRYAVVPLSAKSSMDLGKDGPVFE